MNVYEVGVTLQDRPLAESPMAIEVVAAETDVKMTEIIPSDGLRGTFNFKETKFGLVARDRYGNQVSHGGDRFRVDVDPASHGAGRCRSRIEDNADGTYNVTLTTVEGEQLVAITLNGEHMRGSPFRPSALRLDPRKCSVIGEGMARARAGEPAVFVVETADQMGRPIQTGGVDVQSEISGEQVVVRPTVTDNNDGSYRATYVATVAMSMHLAVEVMGSHVPDSPFEVSVLPGAYDKQKTAVEGEGVRHGFPTMETTFKIQARDKYGNKLTSGGESFSVTLGKPGQPNSHRPVRVDDNRDGSYTVTYPPMSEDHEADIFQGDQPFMEKVYVKAVDLDLAKTVVEPPTGKARVGQPVSFAVRTFDSNARPLRSGGAQQAGGLKQLH